MHNISEKDKRIWNYYTSNLNSIKRTVKKHRVNTKSFEEFYKVLRPNNSFTLDSKIKKQLHSKNFVFDAIVDLHGKSENQAFDIIKNFVKNSFLNKFKSIIIITGKGLNNQGKLKLKTPLWLKSKELSKFIVGFEFMPHNKGGEGALFIKLKNRSKYKFQ